MGSGSFGSVYRCSIGGFVCAVKTIQLQNNSQLEDDKEYLKAEIRTLQKLDSNYIVKYLGSEISYLQL